MQTVKSMNSYKINLAWSGKERIEQITLYGSADSEEAMEKKIREIIVVTEDCILKITKQEFHK